MKKLTLIDLEALRGAGGLITIAGRPIAPAEQAQSRAGDPQHQVPAPPPAPSPPAPQPDPRLQQMIDVVQAQGRSMADLMAVVLDKLQAPPPVVVKMRPTSFEVIRNLKGEPVSLAPTYGEGRPSIPTSFEQVRDEQGLTQFVVPIY